MQFENEETRKLFSPTRDRDQKVYQPGSQTHGEFEGPLSEIPPAVAESMFVQGCNLLKRTASPVVTKTGSGGDKA
jgi:hypothetical protein